MCDMDMMMISAVKWKDVGTTETAQVLTFTRLVLIGVPDLSAIDLSIHNPPFLLYFVVRVDVCSQLTFCC